MASVTISPAAEDALCECYRGLDAKRRTLLGSPEHLATLVREVLSMDFRSIHQRTSTETPSTPQAAGLKQQVLYSLRLSGIQIGYTIDKAGVRMWSAELIDAG